MKTLLRPGDFVARLGQEFPKGVVQSRLPGGMVAVKWPSGLWWKHHNSELRKIA